jgi:hypothetical protein
VIRSDTIGYIINIKSDSISYNTDTIRSDTIGYITTIMSETLGYIKAIKSDPIGYITNIRSDQIGYSYMTDIIRNDTIGYLTVIRICLNTKKYFFPFINVLCYKVRVRCVSAPARSSSSSCQIL